MEPVESSVQVLKKKLYSHSIYNAVNDLTSVQIFMQHHVVCVWDFMCLVKSLRASLTGGPHQGIWVPPVSSEAVRFLNEIMLDEETDEISPGVFMSHFELYCQAMTELMVPMDIEGFIRQLPSFISIEDAIEASGLPAAAKSFTKTTLKMVHKPVHIQAAVFCQSRESVIPGMFRRILETLDLKNVSCSKFRTYLERHIAIDEEKHGPMADKLMYQFCYNDPVLHKEAMEASEEALTSRMRLWDETLRAIQKTKQPDISPSKGQYETKGETQFAQEKQN